MNVDEFSRKTNEFAREIETLLDSCLVGETKFDNARINKEELRSTFKASKHLTIGKSRSTRASISCLYRLCTNSTGRHLAVEESSFVISYKATTRSTPIVRFEYERNARNKPVSHFHFHADSVPLGLVLARGGNHKASAQQQDIHFPMGGHRFRVCLEDIIELVIREFGAEPVEGWEGHVERGRQRYRKAQMETIIRKNLPEAVKQLRNLGFEVIPPEGFKHSVEAPPTEW